MRAGFVNALSKRGVSSESIEFTPYGSWTLTNEQAKRGAEADECYIFGPNPKRKPRPDLAIDLIWTSGGIDKLNVYRKLRVREIWMWKQGHMQVHVLRGAHYQAVPASEALPGIDLVQLASFLDRPTASQAIRDYRDALRGE